LKVRVASKAVTLVGWVFCSLPSVLAFIMKYVPPTHYYLFHKFVSFSESISDPYKTWKKAMLEISLEQKNPS
jgi:hypothetical protein